MTTTIKRHKAKYTRINSADPEQQAVVASQWAARKKRVVSGQIKTHFVTKSGKVVANRKPDGYDERGRPIHRAANMVKIVMPSGQIRTVTAREAMRLITKRTIRLQAIGPA